MTYLSRISTSLAQTSFNTPRACSECARISNVEQASRLVFHSAQLPQKTTQRSSETYLERQAKMMVQGYQGIPIPQTNKEIPKRTWMDWKISSLFFNMKHSKKPDEWNALMDEIRIPVQSRNHFSKLLKSYLMAQHLNMPNLLKRSLQENHIVQKTALKFLRHFNSLPKQKRTGIRDILFS